MSDFYDDMSSEEMDEWEDIWKRFDEIEANDKIYKVEVAEFADILLDKFFNYMYANNNWHKGMDSEKLRTYFKQLYTGTCEWRYETFWNIVRHYREKDTPFFQFETKIPSLDPDYKAIARKEIEAYFKPEDWDEYYNERIEMKESDFNNQEILHSMVKSMFANIVADYAELPSGFFREVNYITYILSIELEQNYHNIFMWKRINKERVAKGEIELTVI